MPPTRKPVVRRSSDRLGRFGRDIVVILGPGPVIGFREFGRRRTYETTVGACMSLAVKQELACEHEARADARKTKRAKRAKGRS